MRTKPTKHTSVNGKKKGSVGRPSSFKPEYIKQAFTIVSQTGLTNHGLAKVFGIGSTTLDMWKRKHPKFGVAIKDGWYAYTTKRVERSLAQRAVGYEYDEVHTEAIVLVVDGVEKSYVEKKSKIRVGTNKKGKPVFKSESFLVEGVKRKVVHKKAAPSDTAMFFWLCNRHPGAWKNVQRSIVESTNKHIVEEKPFDYSKLSKDDLFAARDRLMKATAAQARKDREQEREREPEPVMN